MVKKTYEGAIEADTDVSPSGTRPVRRAQKAKSASRSRKRRRKASSVPGGIHQRANKRMSW